MAVPGATGGRGLDARIVKTLDLAHRWGYGLSTEQLARLLYGGMATEGEVSNAVSSIPSVIVDGGFAALRGHERILNQSIARHRSNGHLSNEYLRIARDFADDLRRHSPFVRAVAISGSTASGGLREGDDIDLNLLAETGTKYVVYLTAVLLGLKYSMRYRRRFASGSSPLGLLPKVTCINVVWTEDQWRPFARQDEFLAFEILRSMVIAGGAPYRELLEANPWLRDHFPQIYQTAAKDQATPPRLSGLARIQRRLSRSAQGRRAMDALARGMAQALHRVVDLTRERNPQARERAAFLRRVKFPYDVFQD